MQAHSGQENQPARLPHAAPNLGWRVVRHTSTEATLDGHLGVGRAETDAVEARGRDSQGGPGTRGKASLSTAVPVPQDPVGDISGPITEQRGPQLNLSAHPFSPQAPAFSIPFMDF